MVTARAVSRTTPPLVVDLIGLVPYPSEFFPDLLSRIEPEGSVLEPVFGAVLGIFLAYLGAGWLALGDHFGFAGTLAGVVLVGATIGVLGVFFGGGALAKATDLLKGEGDSSRMHVVLAFPAWVFIPVLALVVPTELALYGAQVFSSARPDAPQAVVLALYGLELAAVVLYAGMVAKGTALATKFRGVRAAQVIGVAAVELVLLVALVLVVSAICFIP
ncbi:MAG TPA: hypothetical protein VFQ38_12925 [Longimicrobiales bacterium]|nr:hypothetical protein [Longimicrobiales bacterium]